MIHFREFCNDVIKWLFHWPTGATRLYRVSFWILWTIVVGILAIFFKSNEVIWGLASLSSGGLLGFLFGIPRVEQNQVNETAVGVEPRTLYRQSVNTNLTEISDWLTKIIVGVGLIQMTQIPPAFESLVRFLAGTTHSPGLVGGVLVFFGVTGFISGYLLTRLFLATAFSEADQAANEFNLKSTSLPIQAASIATPSSIDFIRNSPRTAVLDNWESLLNAARESIRRKNPEIQVPRLGSSVRNKLMELQLINEQQADTFDKLRNLRNIAAHSSDGISEEAAADYVNNATLLLNLLNSTPPPNTI